MPLLFIFIGVMLIASAINDKTDQLVGLIKGDFTSSNGKESFIVWVLALVILGMLGYVKELKPISNGFIVLVLLVMILSNGAFFDKFTQALNVNNGAT